MQDTEAPVPPRTPSTLKDFLFCAPERERGQGPQSPAKFPSIRKRQRAPPPPQEATPLDFQPGSNLENDPTNREMMLKLSAENLELKHQISVISSQLTTLQSSMAAQIGAFTAQMANMAQQIARLPRSANPSQTNQPTTTPPKLATKPTTLKLTLQKKAPQVQSQQAKLKDPVSYAGVAAQGEMPTTDISTKNIGKRNQKSVKTLKPLYEPNDQKVIIQLHPSTPPAKDIQTTWQYLRIANKAVREYCKELDYCFIRCHVTLKQNLVLQTSLKTKGSDFLPYLDAIKNALQEEAKLQVTAIDGESRWSKFLLHGVPVTSTMGEVASSIMQSYPGAFKLAQTPRWLTTDAKRQASDRGMSTVVLSIAGQHTLQSLGHQHLYVCNSRCRLDKYLPFGPSSQCGNCYRFGHPTSMCQDKKPTCGVCGKEHATRFHPCPAPDCSGGGRCLHSPTHCVNCNNSLYSSINPLCPTRAKVRLQKENSGTTPEFDTSVQLHPPAPPNTHDPMQS